MTTAESGAGRLWKARDRLLGALVHRADDELLNPRSGAESDSALEAWRERNGGSTLQLGDYLRLAKRRWWAIALGLLVGLSAGYAFTATRTQEYTSTASVNVSPIGTDSAVANGRTTSEVTPSGVCAEIGSRAPLSNTKYVPSLVPCKIFDSPMKSAANRLAGCR